MVIYDIIYAEAWNQIMEKSEAATKYILREKVFLEISQNSQENTCARVPFLIKLQAWDSCTGVLLWILWNF